MTQKEFFMNVISANISEEMNTKAQEMIDVLDRKNQKRRETSTKTQKENVALKEQIMTMIRNGEIETVDGYVTGKTTGVAIGYSTQKATALLLQLATSGELTVEEIKSDTGKVKGFLLA